MPKDERPWPRLMRAGILKGETFDSQKSYDAGLAAAKKKAAAAERRKEQRVVSDAAAARIAAKGKAEPDKLSRSRSK